jgi:hypothetical protein
VRTPGAKHLLKHLTCNATAEGYRGDAPGLSAGDALHSARDEVHATVVEDELKADLQ